MGSGAFFYRTTNPRFWQYRIFRGGAPPSVLPENGQNLVLRPKISIIRPFELTFPLCDIIIYTL